LANKVAATLPDSQTTANALPADFMDLFKLAEQSRKFPERDLVGSV
jgi:hypothetical protein